MGFPRATCFALPEGPTHGRRVLHREGREARRIRCGRGRRSSGRNPTGGRPVPPRATTHRPVALSPPAAESPTSPTSPRGRLASPEQVTSQFVFDLRFHGPALTVMLAEPGDDADHPRLPRRGRPDRPSRHWREPARAPDEPSGSALLPPRGGRVAERPAPFRVGSDRRGDVAGILEEGHRLLGRPRPNQGVSE